MLALLALLAAGALEAPSYVDIAELPVHTRGEGVLVLTNAGDKTLKVTNFSIEGDPTIALDAPSKLKLKPGASASVMVSATLREPGAREARVRFEADGQTYEVEVEAWTPGASPHAGVLGTLKEGASVEGLIGSVGMGSGGLGGSGGSGGLSTSSSTPSNHALDVDGARISFGEPIILGALDRAVIDGVFIEQRPALARCFSAVPAANPGTVTIKFTIAATGEVSQALVKSTTVSNPEVEACVLQVVQAQRFPPPRGGGIVIASYPFRFSRP